VAQLYLRGELGKGELLINESVIGSVFTAKVIKETMVGDIPAVIPEVSGHAYICGFSNWIIDDRDPLRNGFLVR